MAVLSDTHAPSPQYDIIIKQLLSCE